LSAAEVNQLRHAGISSPQQEQVACTGQSFKSRMILSSGFLVLGRGISGKLNISTVAIQHSPDRISGEIGISRSSALLKLDAVFSICLSRVTTTLLMTAKSF
jgi:hypothetical protein